MRINIKIAFLFIIFSIMLSPARPMEGSDWQTYRFRVRWGIQTKTKQVWDGHAELDKGKILKIQPFLRREILDDPMIVSEHSWKSKTYGDVEGVYVIVKAPADAVVSIFTATHDFKFGVEEIGKDEVTEFFDGEIDVTNNIDEVLYRISGLEYGVPGKGTATVSPKFVNVGEIGTWKITYTAGEGGIPAGGGIRIAWHFTRSWGEPQYTDPTAKNYVTAVTDGDCRLDYKSEHRGLFEYPFNLGRILVRVLDKPLKEGEEIVVTLGDRSGGSFGYKAPVVSEKGLEFRVEDCTEVVEGDFPVYRRLPELPKVDVIAHWPDRAFAVAPSIVTVNETFNLKLVLEDDYRNAILSFKGKLRISIGDKQIRELYVSSKEGAMIMVPDIKFDSPGTYRLAVTYFPERVWADKNWIMGVSNPIKCVPDRPAEKLVWGELHGHTVFSDGHGTADDYFRFARERALLDFAAITDHDVELDAPDYTVAEMWKYDNDAVLKYNDPPEFCTIPAYEWSPARRSQTTIAPFGDHNVFYEKEYMPIFKACDPESNTLPKLYGLLEGIDDCLVQVIPHVGGAVANLDYHNPKLESVFELYSVHGCFESVGDLLLQRGYVMGFVSGSDSHNGQVGGFPPGLPVWHFNHGGLTAVHLPDLSRRNILEAIKNRRTYATSGERIFLDFKVNGRPMGSIIKTAEHPVIKAEIIGTEALLTVEVIKNGRVIHTWENSYRESDDVGLLWGNYVEPSNLQEFDASLWSYHIRSVDWAGGVRAEDGGISLVRTYSFDYPKDGIPYVRPDRLRWKSLTRGGWDGVALKLDNPETALAVELGEYSQDVPLADEEPGLKEYKLGQSDRLWVVKGVPESSEVAIGFTDYTIIHDWNYYYLRVTQLNGEMAWSSPIWIEKDGIGE